MFSSSLLILPMYIFQLISLSICLEGTTTSDSLLSTERQSLIRNLRTVCSDVHICGQDFPASNVTPSVLSGQRVEPCCKECSCAITCGLNKSCCFQDLDEYNLLKRTRQSCEYLVTKGMTDVEQLRTNYKAFYIVTENPLDGCKYSPEYISKTAIDTDVQCGRLNISSWGSLLPLYSKKSKMIYKNRHCAECHGVNDAYLLNGTINCEQYDLYAGKLDASSHVQFLNTQLQSPRCFLNFPLYENNDVEESEECLPDRIIIDTCNEELFEIPDYLSHMTHLDITAACKSRLYSPYARKFANVFCSICYGVKATDIVCTATTEYRKVSNDGLFVSLIDFNFFGSDQPESTGLKYICDKTMAPTGDVESCDCRTLFCPSGQLRYDNGNCRYPITLWQRNKFIVYLKLIPLFNDQEVMDIFSSIRNIHSTPFLKTPWGKDWKLDNLYRILQENDDITPSNFGVTLRMRSYKQYIDPGRFIQRGIATILQTSWKLELGGQIYEMHQEFLEHSISPDMLRAARPTGEHSDSVSNIINRTSVLESLNTADHIPFLTPLFWTVDRRDPEFNMIITKMYFCNQIELIDAEFSFIEFDSLKLLNYSRENKIMLDGQYALVTDTYGNFVPRICIEDSRFYTPTDSTNPVKEVKYLHLIVIFTLHVTLKC